MLNKSLRRRAAFEPILQRDRRSFSLALPQIQLGFGDETMRHKAVPAATMIVAASLIGVTQARLPRPIRDYRERVGVEISTIALLDDNVDWLGMRHGASIGRHWRAAKA